MERTKIEWCDHTFNGWEGCTRVSPGCLHCYAEGRNARFGGGTAPNWGAGAPRRRTSPDYWRGPLKWNSIADSFRECTRCGRRDHMADVCYHCGGGETTAARQRVFCASLSDWLDEEVPIDWLADLLDLIRRTPHLDWLLLTKRPQDWQARLDQVRCERLTTPEHGTVCRDLIIPWLNGYVPPNLWIGTTVEDQTRVDQRIPELLKIPARVRFLSCEPLLGPVDLSMWLDLFMTYPVRHTPEGPGSFVRTGPIEWKPSPPSPFGDSRDEIHWVITGGESGPKARPMHPDWARSLREQCVAAGLPFLFKQWGEWLPITPVYDGHDEEYMDGTDPDRIEVLRMDGSIWPWTSGQPPLEGCPWFVERVGKKAAGRLLDGEEHNTFPEGGAK